MNTASPSFRRTGSPSERARHEPSSTYMICSALACRCSRWTVPGGSSTESKMILRAPALSLLMTFLTIKPSWSALVITCSATSLVFLICTVLLDSQSLASSNLFDRPEGVLDVPAIGRSTHEEEYPTGRLTALYPS